MTWIFATSLVLASVMRGKESYWYSCEQVEIAERAILQLKQRIEAEQKAGNGELVEALFKLKAAFEERTHTHGVAIPWFLPSFGLPWVVFFFDGRMVKPIFG